MRKLLYLCAMRARSCNKACKEMFERLKEKGKNGKLALIAIANKLLRQAFVIGKSQINYKESWFFAWFLTQFILKVTGKPFEALNIYKMTIITRT